MGVDSGMPDFRGGAGFWQAYPAALGLAFEDLAQPAVVPRWRGGRGRCGDAAAAPPLPSCPRCGGLARPNILMFGDADWDDRRATEQYGRYSEWQKHLRAERARVVVVECGAGKAIPTVRLQAQRVARELGGLLVRINVREPDVPAGQVGLAMGVRAALTAIDERVAALR